MTASRTARERARAELTAEITDAARRQLASGGAAALSLRAVARELGMASSAIYRYFSSRDELLTALLIDAYNTVGERAEAADATARKTGADFTERWVATWHGVRDWALEHRHEFALLFGTPVPGYAAPAETTTASSRTPLVLAGIVNEAADAGRLASLADNSFDTGLITAEITALATPAVPPQNLSRLLTGWAGMIGAISFELFGHFNGIITDYRAYYDHHARVTAEELGLPG